MRADPISDAEALRFTVPKALLRVAACGVVALMAFAAAVSLGEEPISLWTAFQVSDSPDAAIFWSLRLPRAVLAALVGAALAASGTTLQGLMRNPLADPFVLGVSGGAALGATLALAIGAGTIVVGGALSASTTSLFAFVGAVGATLLVFGMGRVSGQGSSYGVLLSGVIFNAFALAAITFVKTLAAPDQLGQILYWLAGSLGYEEAGTLAVTAGFQAASLGGLWALSGRLNLLSLGDEEAASLGVPVERTRLLLLVLASLSVAAAVALSGLVGFVGLIVPHLLRLWLGPDQRLLIPCSALVGAAFLLLAHLAARLLFRVFQAEPPVGVVTALLGGPFFLFLLRRDARARAA